MCNFWNFGQFAKFHAQIWKFWKLVRISETAARRAKISSISTPCGRKRTYVQLLKLWLLLEYAEIWQCWNLASISESAVHRVRMSSNLSPWGKQSICATAGTLANGQACKFHAQIWQFWKSAIISKTAAHRAIICSISTSWDRKRVYVTTFGTGNRFTSDHYFLASKSTGRFCPFSCSQSQWLNMFFPVSKFHMPAGDPYLCSAGSHKGWRMVSLDLKDAYLHLQFHLSNPAGEVIVYQWKVLLAGHCPRVFAKHLAPVYSSPSASAGISHVSIHRRHLPCSGVHQPVSALLTSVSIVTVTSGSDLL